MLKLSLFSSSLWVLLISMGIILEISNKTEIISLKSVGLIFFKISSLRGFGFCFNQFFESLVCVSHTLRGLADTG